MKLEQIKISLQNGIFHKQKGLEHNRLLFIPHVDSSWQSALWQHCLFLPIILFRFLRLFSTRGFLVQEGALPLLLVVTKPRYWVIIALYMPRSQTRKKQLILTWGDTLAQNKLTRETMKREKHRERLWDCALPTTASGARLFFSSSFPVSLLCSLMN